MNDTLGIVAMLVMMMTIIPLVGVIMAITPYLMKKSEWFTVTVPEIAQQDPFLRGLRKRYLITMLLVTAVLTGLGIATAFVESELAAIVLLSGGTLGIVVIGYGLMLRNRSRVRVYKREQNWVATRQEAVAVVLSEDSPQALSLKWNLLYLPVIALILVIGLAGYSRMPEQIILQVGLDGQPTTIVDKSLPVTFMPALIQLFLALCLFFSHWMITRSKRLSSPSAPATSALAYGMFARAQSMYLLALGMMLSILMIMMPLSFMGVVTLMQAGIFIMVCTLVALVGAIAIAVVYGQGGARVFARMQASETILADEDRFWKLGIFFVNPEDPSLFLLERFGVGWTVNFARPAVWVILALLVVVTVAFVVAISLIA